MARGELVICKDPDSVAEKAAEFFIDCGRKAIAERGRFNVVLSGGSTPKLMFKKLAVKLTQAKSPIELENIYFFLGDERMVPPNSDESNFRMANDLLLQPASVPEANIFRYRTELEPHVAASGYAAAIREHFSTANGIPVFDLVFLGLGTDGHTASLFPGTDVLFETYELVSAVFVPQLDAFRLTLTVPVLNAAVAVAFLVTGEDKRNVLRRVREGDERLPASLISPAGELLWFADEAAAGQP
ncbi:MAG: 6-phosphogluconolactonase [Acidobacteria bacterium]|nr:6-phosphogluconolactonase [Acidobacteriota bacterium]